MSSYRTGQENFWAGEFGDAYIERNQDERSVAANLALFARILERTDSISSVVEFGPNVGLNLVAIRRLLPAVELSAVEINRNAVKKLEELGNIAVYPMSLLDFQPETTWDMVLVKGVLIHIDPAELHRAYERIVSSSRRYICIAEYYNPSPVEVTYRGHRGMLFKRDFAGELMDRYQDLRLVDYGFVYHRDPNFLQDDITWFLLEK